MHAALLIAREVAHPCLLKTLATQAAGIAHAAGPTFRIGLIAAHCLLVVDTEFNAALDDLRLGQILQGRVNAEPDALDPGTGCRSEERRLGKNFIKRWTP